MQAKKDSDDWRLAMPEERDLEVFITDPQLAMHLKHDAELMNIDWAILVQIAGAGSCGLSTILDRAPEETPILGFYDPDNWGRLAGIMEFHACQGHKNVRLLPETIDHHGLRSAYESILLKEGVEDTLARELIGLVDPVTSGLLHRMADSIGQEDKRLQCLARARELGYFGSDNEICRAISDKELSRPVDWSGRVLGGVFCDIAGTLLDGRNFLNEKVFGYLLEQSKTRPITLWTGGKLATTEPKLRMMPVRGGIGISWKLVGKPCFNGATVEEIIDDSPGELAERFGISYVTAKHPSEL